MRSLFRPISIVSLVLLSAVCLAPVACGGKQVKAPAVEPIDAGPPEPVDAGPPPPKNLYEKVGGPEKLASIVGATTKAAMEHPKLKKAFAKTTGPKLEAFKKSMNDFLCEQMKGPCKYEGKDMRAAHKGMGVTEAQWEAFVEVFVKALTDGGVGDAERDEILDLITPLHDEVLNKKK